jgi:hypothetical protein
MIRVVNPGSRIRMLTFSHPGSRGQKGTQSRILDPDPQHWDLDPDSTKHLDPHGSEFAEYGSETLDKRKHNLYLLLVTW